MYYCGTTTTGAPSIAGKVVGDTVVDGGVTWTMRSLTTAAFVPISTLNSSVIRNAQSASYSILTSDYYIAYTGTGGHTFTLPAATTGGRSFLIKHSGTGTLTIARSGSDTIDGATSLTLATYDSALLVADGTSDWERN
jgi:hypothetical protein